MRKLLVGTFACAALWFVATPAQAAYSVVAHTIQGSADGTGFTSGTIDSSGGNTIVFTIGDNCCGTAPTPSDSLTNTWLSGPPTVRSTGGGVRNSTFYCKNCSVGAGHTFTTTTGGGAPTIAILVLGGGHTTAPFDVEDGKSGFGATLTAGTAAITPSEDNAIVIAAVAWNTTTTTAAIDSGFTISDQITKDATHEGVALAYVIQTTAGAVNPTWAFSGTTPAADSELASFKKAGAGGGGATPKSVILGSGVF